MASFVACKCPSYSLTMHGLPAWRRLILTITYERHNGSKSSYARLKVMI